MDYRWAYKQMRSQPRLPFPGHERHINNAEALSQSNPELPSKKISSNSFTKKEFLKRFSAYALQNPNDFEEFVLENTTIETLQKWLSKKKSLVYFQNYTAREAGLKTGVMQTSKNLIEGSGLGRSLFSPTASFHANDIDLKSQIEAGNYLQPLFYFCSHLKTVTLSSGFNFYASNGKGDSLHIYNPDLPHWKINPMPTDRSNSLPGYSIGAKNSVATYVASTAQPTIVDDLPMDERFPKGTAAKESTAISVMCLPLILPNGSLLGVVELYRSWYNATYTPETLAIAKNFLDWVMLAVHKTEVSSGLTQQSEMSNFLLDVSRSYLDDLTDIDSLVRNIMRFAKNLVGAQRCSFFLHDVKSGELYSNLFDAGEEKSGQTVFIKKAEIRFPSSKGIAGYALRTQSIVNVPDAYADKRFNREVDKLTGFTTKCILCIPIMGDGEVYGIVQMINKKTGGSFTTTDEENFRMFAVFCALALKYSKIHLRLTADRCRYEIVKEQYLYHSEYTEKEFQSLSASLQGNDLAEKVPAKLGDFQFSVLPYNSELFLFFVKMVEEVTRHNIDGKVKVPRDTLGRFLLAVRSNYRRLPYHNFHHAVTVSHAMYCILRRNTHVFGCVETLGLMIACVSHDIDHRAMSNQFLRKINHPLAALYPNSTMEYHHFQTTLDIMARENHDVFSCLSREDKQRALNVVEKAIIATDLALYFENRSFIDDLMKKKAFNIKNPEHRMGAISLMMSACDISSGTKEWHETKADVFNLYTEFWAEGDRRKKLNIPLIPMMDRDLEEDLPDSQVGFYSVVVVKCFETLARIFPTCEPMAAGARTNLEKWREEADQAKLAKDDRARKDLEERRRERKHEHDRISLIVKGGLWMVEESRTKL